MKAILISFFLLSYSASAASNKVEEQILEVIAQSGSVLSDPVIGFSDGQKVYLPLLDMGKILGIRIDQTNPAQYAIYLEETEAVTLDVSTCGSAFKQPLCDNFYEKKGILYATDGYMRDAYKWPINVDLKEMRIFVSTKQISQEILSKKSDEKKPVSIKRELIGAPSARVEVGYSSQKDRGTVGIYAAQPLLNHDGDLLYYNEPTKEQLRFTLSKQIFEEDAHSLKPREYALFSAQTTEIKYLFSPTQINGFYVSNRRVDENIFDTQNIYEYGPPRWRVELFINGVYFGQTIIDHDGRFSFLNVPLFYGSNKLIYRLTSPLGSVKEIVRNYDVSNEFAGKRKISYIASFGQIENDSSYIGSAQVNYGISDHFGAQIGFAEIPINETKKSYSLVGLNYLDANYTVGISRASSLDGKEGYSSIVPKVNLAGILFSADHTEFNDLRSLLINKDSLQKQTSLTKASALSQIQTEIPTTFQIQFEEDRFADSPNTQEALVRTYSMFEGSSLLVEASKIWPSPSPADLYVEVGEYMSFFRARYGVLTQNSKYSQSKIAIETNLPGEAYLSITGTLPTDIGESSCLISLSKLLGDVQIEANFIGGQSESTVNILMSTTFKKGIKGLSTSSIEGYRQGHIIIYAFIDENGNGKFDENEKPFSKFRIMHVERQKEYETDTSGVMEIPALNPYQRVGLEVVRESMSNIFLTAPDFQTDFILTPGQDLRIEIPIATSYDVVGVIGSSYYKKLIPLELISQDNNIVAQATTTASGKFKFDDVRAGIYSVRINPEFAEANKLILKQKSPSLEIVGKPGVRRFDEINLGVR